MIQTCELGCLCGVCSAFVLDGDLCSQPFLQMILFHPVYLIQLVKCKLLVPRACWESLRYPNDPENATKCI